MQNESTTELDDSVDVRDYREIISGQKRLVLVAT
jgi:hypothetical protein